MTRRGSMLLTSARPTRRHQQQRTKHPKKTTTHKHLTGKSRKHPTTTTEAPRDAHRKVPSHLSIGPHLTLRCAEARCPEAHTIFSDPAAECYDKQARQQ